MSRTIRRTYEKYEKIGFDSHRDKKKGYKPPKIYKKLQRSSEKAKVKDAIKHIEKGEVEEVPLFKKHDAFDFF